ncbi:MAG: DNA repair protein RadC [Faecalibacterium sp.]|nr:DNA repair protein RadC [Faecalibacterium sp.]MDY3256437.1 DNA repair protein RadC [Eubacteriales bacterium]CCY04304.1 dNA repair protein RadC [Faecalibacterium sp. CAG:1138]
MHEGHRERMRERVINSGIENMPPHEVLEFLLFYAIPRKDTNPIAHRLIDTFGGMVEVMNASVEELMSVEGVTKNAATFLTSFPKLFFAYNRDLLKQKSKIINTADAIKYLRCLFAGERVEKCYVVCLDSSFNVLNCCFVAAGIPNEINVYVRQVAETILKNKATSVIFAHNHPSGNPKPSNADINFTAMLSLTLKALGVKFYDHYIITATDFYSFRNAGLMEHMDDSVTEFIKDNVIRY